MAQVVVVGDFGQRGLGGQPHHLDELFQRVGLVGDGVLHHLLRGVAQAKARENKLVVVDFVFGHEVRGVAMTVWHVDDLLRPLGVEDLVGADVLCGLLGVGRDGLAAEHLREVLAGDVFVHEALASHVEVQVGVHAQRCAHVVSHGGVGAVLHTTAGPDAHEVAVARVHTAAVVGVLGGVVGHHVLVCAVVAAGQDDLLGVYLDVAGVGFGVSARHGAVLVLDELLTGGAEDDLAASGYACVHGGLAGPLHVGVRGDGAVEVGIELLAVVVALVAREALRADVALLVGFLLGGRTLEHLEVRALDEPVEVDAGVVVPVGKHPWVDAGGALLLHLVHDDLFGRPLDAQVLLNLRAHDAEVAGHVDDRVRVLGLLFQGDGLHARLGRGLEGCGAGQAHTDDEDVAVLLVDDVGGNLGLGEESGGLGGGHCGLVGHGDAGTCEDASCGGTGNERTARNAHVNLLFLTTI